jgi:hypothetical protein
MHSLADFISGCFDIPWTEQAFSDMKEYHLQAVNSRQDTPTCFTLGPRQPPPNLPAVKGETGPDAMRNMHYVEAINASASRE